MKINFRAILGVVLALALVLTVACAPFGAKQEAPAAPPTPDLSGYDITGAAILPLTRFERVQVLSSSNGPGMYINQDGTGEAFRVDVAGVEIFAVENDGSLTYAGTFSPTGSIDLSSSLEVTGTAEFHNTVTIDGATTVGGGYGVTGATISSAGVGQFNGALTTDGALTADNVVCTNAATFGGGYGTTGCTVSTAGALSCNDAVIAGGGYADTGVTLSATGVGQFAGALTTDGALTADNIVCTNAATFGGGFGAAGCTVSTAGALSCDGAAILGSTAHITGVVDLEATLLAEAGADFRTYVYNGGANYSGALGVADSVIIDGAADAVQLTVQGYTTQTALSFVVENSAGTDEFTVSNAGAIVAVGSATVDSAVIGGGYGVTGATISAAGVGQFNGALTTDGAMTSGTAVVGGGYGTTGCTTSSAGAISCDDAIIAGGGYGNTGVTLSAAGVGQFDGALTTGGALTADNLVCTNAATFGGGFGSSGCSITTAGALSCDGAAFIDGGADAVQLTVQGNATQTSNLLLLESSAGTDRLAVAGTGQVVFTPVADADAANYDNLVSIEYAMTGTGTKDRNYGLLIEGTREAGQEIAAGDHDEAGLKIRVDTEAITTTAGTTLRAIDAEAKADNPGGTVTNLYGAAITAKSDTSAGSVANMIALTTNAQANAEVTASMMAADLRLMRQSANEPTAEYVLQVRNSSTAGTGADAGIYVTSDYSDSLTTDDMDYGIDFSTADITTATIRFENGTTLGEQTNTVLSFSEFLGATEQTAEVVTAGSTIIPTGTYQPLTSATSVTVSTTIPITAGTFTGQLLILVNENATNTITIDGTGGTVECKADVVLGAQDTLMLLWNGADWICLAGYDNS